MKATKRPDRSLVSKQIIVGLLAVALTTSVISVVQTSSLTAASSEQAAPNANGEQKRTAQEPVKLEAPVNHQEKQAAVPEQPKVPDQAAAPSEPAKAVSAEAGESTSNRKGRAEAEKDKEAPATKEGSETKSAESKPVEKSTEKAKLDAKTAASSKSSKPASKSGSKSKINANLGMVTSTGSGGPTHHLSNHDAYSAIAEKHGAAVHEVSRKSEKRGGQSAMQRFGGIQKAGGFNDVLNPFKGLTDSGLARSLGASMRSIMKGKYSVPAYVASALLGAVALLAFYESPISPLPVPPLPEPPIGRFPPEMPNISPNAQVPFRPNQQQYNQQGYSNQRSFTNGLAGVGNYQQQQPQQVLFPGSQNAQQRQMNVGTQQQAAGPVQQLAANLANLAGKQQNAQRKSSPDYDQSSSRSFFGSASGNISPKMGSPANQQQQKQNSILSFFGLGGSSASSTSSAASSSSQASSPTGPNTPAQAAGDISQIAGSNPSASQTSGSPAGSTSSLLEPKGQASNGLSNSHVVNKVKSYFSRSSVSPASGSSASAGISSSANSNPYDQYQRMSFVQALLKDTAFLPAFLTSNRKSSTAPTNKISSLTSAFAPNPVPAARMQVDNQYGSQLGQMYTAQKQPQKPASNAASSGALARVAHAFLETFTSGISQRNAVPPHDAPDAKKHGDDSYQGQSSSASAVASLFTDLVSNYGASIANGIDSASQGQQQQQQYDQQQAKSAASQQTQSQQATNQPEGHVASGRSDDQEHHSTEPQKQQGSAGGQHSGKQQQVAAIPSPASPTPVASASASDNSQQAHVRKTRSIGLEYPVESNQNLALREQHVAPSKAAQINNVIDFVADSYSNNRMLFNFVMNQVGLSHAVPYVEQILASGANDQHHH